MTTALFVIGAMTSLGCSWNVMVAPGNWKRDLVWVLGGTIGATMMVLAIYLSQVLP